MRIKRLLWMLPMLLLSIGVSGAAQVIAQATCPQLVQRALLAVNENCDDLERNAACYGYNLVSASFTEEVAEDFFVAPADRSEVVLLETLSTSAMDVDNDIWGVALMNLQANIPNTIPGQNVKFVLIGDTTIENAVDPADAHSPVDSIGVTTTGRLNVRSGPSLNNNAIGIAPSATVLDADGLSADGAWVRVVYGGLIGWVAREFIDGDGVDDLPTLDNTTRLPMQAFYLRTGVGAIQCDEAPEDALLVQGPDNFTVEMTINGAEIRLSSTMIARIIPGETTADDLLEITAVSGSVEVQGTTLQAGEKTALCLDTPINDGADGMENDRLVSCPPSTPEPVSLEEQQGWCSLGLLDSEPLNYRVPVDCDQGFTERTAPDPVEAVEQEQPRISSQPPIAAVDCSGFQATSPLGQVAEDSSQFYWDAPADNAITGYALTVNTGSGTQTAQATTTNATIDNLQLLDTISWRVDALIGQEVVCSTETISAQVVGAPPVVVSTPEPIVPNPVFTANWSCTSSNYEVLIFWSDAGPTDVISATVTDDDTTTFNNAGTGSSGSFVIPVDYSFLTNIDITNMTTGDSVGFALPFNTLCKPVPIDISSFICSSPGSVEVSFNNALPGQLIEAILVDSVTSTPYSATTIPSGESDDIIITTTPGQSYTELKLEILSLSEGAIITFTPPLFSC